jgi:hypothetical protein
VNDRTTKPDFFVTPPLHQPIASYTVRSAGRQPSMVASHDTSPSRRRASMTPSEKVKEIMLAQKESGIHPQGE